MSDGVRPKVETLASGLRLLVAPLPHAHSVSVSIYVSAGARYEAAPEDAGLSHFVEHLCFKGTERRPDPRTVAAEIDTLGGSFNAATNHELTVYYGKVTPERTEQAIDLLVDVLRNSLFRDDEIERERGVILEELAAVEDAPDEQVAILLDGLLWPNQPLGRDVAGTPDSVSALPAERLRRYFRQQYVANMVVVSVAGAIEVTKAYACVKEAVAGWLEGEPAGWVPAVAEPRGPRIHILGKETEQAHISLGMRGIDAHDNDRYALGLLSIILGEGMSSRLFTRLREELGLCYDVHSSSYYLRDAGTFAVHAGVDPGNAAGTVREIVAELSRAREPVAAEELERAKEMVRARIQLQLEDSRAVSAWYGSRLALELPLHEPEEVIACFEQVTRDDVQRVAQRLIANERLHLAVVGPVEHEPLEEALRLND